MSDPSAAVGPRPTETRVGSPGPDLERRDAHRVPLRLGDVTICFKFAFDVGRNVHPLEAAGRLLETDLALSAVWLGQVWDASRHHTLKDMRQTYEELMAGARRLDDGLWAYTRYMARRPRLLLHLWRTRRGSNDVGGDDDMPPTDGAGSDDDDFGFDDVDDAVAHTSMLQKLLDFVDADLFNPDFLKDGPWVRIELQPVFCTTSGHEFNIDVWLVLHTTGSAVMTFVVRHEDEDLSPAELDDLTRTDRFRFEETELPLWAMRASAVYYASDPLVEPDATRFSSGIEWARWRHKEAVPLSSVFRIYQDATLATLNARRPAKPKVRAQPFASQWACYPVVVVRDADPRVFDLDDEDAQLQLGGLIARVGDGGGFRADMLLRNAAQDLSLADSQRSWVNGAHALSVISPEHRQLMAARRGVSEAEIPGQDWIFLEQVFAVPFDFLLLRDHTAHALAMQAQHLPHTPRSLHDLKARALAAKLSFLRASPFSYVTLRSFAQAFESERGTAESWALADQALDAIGGVLETEERAAADRRALGVQLVLGIIAVVLGFPAAHRFVEVLGGVQEQDSDAWWGLGEVINALTTAARESPGPLTVGLILLLVAVLVVAVAGAGGRRHLRQPGPLVQRAQGPPPRRPPFQYFEPEQGFRWVVERRSADRPTESSD